MNSGENFFHWYLVSVSKTLFARFLTSIWFLHHFFTPIWHLQCLFFPWKRIYKVDHQPGFDLARTLDIWSFNFISRLIGAMIRSVIVIGYALTFSLVCVAWLLIFIGWVVSFLLTPFLYVVHLLISSKSSQAIDEVFTSVELFVPWLRKNDVAKSLFARLELDEEIFEAFCQIISTLSFELHTDQEKDLASSTAWQTLAAFEQIVRRDEVRSFFESRGVLIEDVVSMIAWQKDSIRTGIENAERWSRKNLVHVKPIGKDWNFGFTPTLDQFGQDMRTYSNAAIERNVRPEIIEQIERVFSKDRKTSILLVGQPGVGKKTMLSFLAQKIGSDDTTEQLWDHRVVLLRIEEIVSLGKTYGEQLLLIDQLFREVMGAGNIIVVIDNFDRFVTAGSNTFDLSPIFEKFQNNNKVKMIGIVTPESFRSRIVTNSKIFTSVEVIQIQSMSQDQTLEVMEHLATYLENTKRLFISFVALREIIAQTDSVFDSLPFPEKAVDLLDECVSSVLTSRNRVIDQKIVDAILTSRTGTAIGNPTKDLKEKLTNLESFLHQRVIGQEAAIGAVSKALRRASVGLGNKEKTMGSLLFLGTTGVGKTETTKALAELFFGSKDSLVRIDCGEYTEAASLRNLIGSPTGTSQTNEGGQLTEAVRKRPYCVVLFDELEKAHPQILTALLTVFDEGYLTDARGEKISFRHTIVIATSNASSELIHELLIKRQEPVDIATTQVIDSLIDTKIFLPEFVNRFDSIILFTPLSRAEITSIAKLKLATIVTRVRKQHGVTLAISDSFLNKLSEDGYNQQFGARFLERKINDSVIDQVTNALLTDEVKKGGVLHLT